MQPILVCGVARVLTDQLSFRHVTFVTTEPQSGATQLVAGANDVQVCLNAFEAHLNTLNFSNSMRNTTVIETKSHQDYIKVEQCSVSFIFLYRFSFSV